MRALALAAFLLELAACGAARIKPYLSDEEVAALQPDTKATCLVGAGVSMPRACHNAPCSLVEKRVPGRSM